MRLVKRDAGCVERQADGFLGNHDGGRPQQAVAQFVAFAKLLDDVAFGHVRGFLLRNGFMQVRVERLAGGVHFFQAGVGQRGFQLLLNHRNAGGQRWRSEVGGRRSDF